MKVWRRGAALGVTVAATLMAGALFSTPVVASEEGTADTTADRGRISASAQPSVQPAATGAKVSGKLKGKVSHIIVLGPDGKQLSKITPKGNGSFKGVVTKGSSLQLIGTDGAYAGPIVLGQDKKGKLAYTYFSAKKLSGKVDLGTVNVKTGYAKTKKSASTKVLNTSKAGSAVASKGVPVGARASGVVEVATTSMLATAASQLASADLDRDGYPNVFDIDLNGNKIFNNVDTTTRSGTITPNTIFTLRATRAKGMDVCPPPPAEKPAGCTDPTPGAGTNTGGAPGTTPSGPAASDPSVRIFSNFKSTDPSMKGVVNANLFSSSATSAEVLAAVDKALQSFTTLAIEVVTGGSYSCSMAYCPTSPFSPTAGGTGDFQWPIGQGVAAAGISGYTSLTHNQIGSGDAFTVTTTDGGTIPGVLNFAFTTNPALKSYQIMNADGSASGVEVAVTYSDAGASAGTQSAPITVPAGKRVKLTWYVPQRLAVTGESGFGPDGIFMNMGGLNYVADMPNQPTGATGTKTGNGRCATGSLFDGAGAAVTGESVTDTTTDDNATGRTFSFQVDLDKCISSSYSGGGTWTQADFDIQAVSDAGDNAAQKIRFARGVS